MGLRGAIDDWLEAQYPTGDDVESEAEVRARTLTRATTWLLVPVVAVYVVVYGVTQGWTGPRTELCALALVLLLIGAASMDRLGVRRVGRVLSALLVGILVVSEHLYSDLHLAVMPWLVATPLVTLVLAGPRWSFWFVLLGATAHGGLVALHRFGILPVPDVASTDPTFALPLMDTLLATGMVLAVGAIYESSRRRTERLARRSMAELRRANRDLRQARDAADEANRAKTQFVANISHELRTPMNGVIGMADLLRASEVTEEQLEYVETVHRSARALLGIIDDILDFSKLDFDKLELTVKRFDPEEVIEEALSLLAAQAYAKGLEISATLARDVPSDVVSDAGRLRQVLVNLLSNAIKFTERGEVNVTCTLVKAADPHALLRFEVNDTGIGIPKQTIARIFDAFYQTDDSSTRQHGGTGLGLAISKRLVELMGGQIGVDSDPDRGTTFYFTHPVQVPEDVLDLGDERSRTFTGLRGLSLVLGDRPRARRALAALLEREGVLADNAPSLDEAMSALARAQAQELPYRVCVIDVPPELGDPIALADKLRRVPLAVSPAVVVLIPHSQRELRHQVSALGFATPVSKPVRRAALMAGIASALSEASRTRHARTESGRAIPQLPAEEAKGQLLLAEDNETNRRTAMLMLRKLGYDVDVATNGQEVLERLEVERYDAILMDCQMPLLDGYQTAARIRGLLGEARHTIIVAMTAHASASDRRRCLDSGMNDYLPKPVRFEDLRGMLDKWLHGAALTSTPPPARGPEPDGAVDLEMLASLRNMAGEDQHMVTALIGAYLEEAPTIIADLETRVRASDAAGAADAVHKLKSSSGNLGAKGLSQLCRRLESRARDGDLSEAQDILTHIQSEFSRVRAALAPLVEG